MYSSMDGTGTGDGGWGMGDGGGGGDGPINTSTGLIGKVHGAEHPLVATTQNNLGICYKKLSRYGEALDVPIPTQKHQTTKCHINLITEILLCHKKLGRYDQALDLHFNSKPSITKILD